MGGQEAGRARVRHREGETDTQTEREGQTQNGSETSTVGKRHRGRHNRHREKGTSRSRQRGQMGTERLDRWTDPDRQTGTEHGQTGPCRRSVGRWAQELNRQMDMGEGE